jgi:hypothetical protein
MYLSDQVIRLLRLAVGIREWKYLMLSTCDHSLIISSGIAIIVLLVAVKGYKCIITLSGKMVSGQ